MAEQKPIRLDRTRNVEMIVGPKPMLPGYAGVLGRIAGCNVFANETVEDLKGRSLRGGAVMISAQGLKFILQTGSILILARLLTPADFGLQSMVVAMTGFLGLFRDVGLSVATIQRDVVTHEQTSTLFWINTAVGLLLAAVAVLLAPVLVAFYREPRLFWMTIVSGAAFIFNGVAAQHQALLVRRLRFIMMAWIDALSFGLSIAIGIVMAFLGFGYWALIGMAVSGPAIAAAAVWIAVPWIPGAPKRRCGIRSMLHLGGTTTANMVVTYMGYNAEKFLLGRFWGAAPLGFYSRAYQLVNVPLQQLTSSISNVIFPALSRLQGDIDRLSRYFLKSYSLVVSICVPIALSCAFFAESIIPIVLGLRWTASIPILRLLSPTIVSFALINPFGWFLLSTGRAWRSLQTAFLITPVVILGITAGLHDGPRGVALGYSSAMILLIVPFIAWAIKGTGMKGRDVWQAVRPPIVSGLPAAMTGILFTAFWDVEEHRILRLILGLVLMHGTYVAVLFFVMRQRDVYLALLKHLVRRD